MIEVLWHGRGGQGAFTAARLLGAAASMADGRHALAFPSFGPERRGAPMRAFTKMDDVPIGDRSAVAQADYVVYLDDTLLGDGWECELKPGGLVLANSTRTFDDPRIVALDADGISTAVLGRPIPNTVFLGALAALCDRVELADVEEAVRQYMPAKLHAKNIEIVQAAREAVSRRDEGGSARRPERVEQAEGSPVASAENTATAPQRPASRIPTLRSGALDPAEFAHSTCFEGGYLTVKNAGWRNIRPVIDAAVCTGYLQCYLYCPDGAVYKTSRSDAVNEGSCGASDCSESFPKRASAREESLELQDGVPHEAAASGRSAVRQNGGIEIDYDFCKGCGVCAKACRFGAITMIPESEADAR